MKVSRFIIYFFLLFTSMIYADSISTVYVIPVHGVLDLGLSKFVNRVCVEAKEKKIDLVILDIDIFGGRIDAAIQICDSLAGLGDIPVTAFVTGKAWGVGALISLAGRTIIMTPESSIGSAEGGSWDIGEDLADEKTISLVTAKFKETAERNGHSVKLADAMADKNIELILVKTGKKIEILDSAECEAKDKEYKKKEGLYTVLCAKGELLSLTSDEAKDLGLAKDIFDTKKELLGSAGMKDARVINCKLSWSEVLIRAITNPIVGALLLTIGFLGLIFELRIPGWGLSGTFSIIALGLFLGGHYLAGLASWKEIILFLIGIGFLLVEVFIIPNFKAIGISGIIFIVISLFLALIKNPSQISQRELSGALFIIVYTFVLSLIIAIAGLKLLPKSRVLRKLVLPKPR